MANLNIIANINPSVMKTLAGVIIPEEALDYIDRVLADSGVIDDNDTLYDIVRFYRDNNLLTDTKLLAAPFLGSKLRTSGIYKYLSKLYSVELPANDLSQTTELNQPYQSGNIAPNEVLSMQNPNGDARFMTHPAISFAANQAWSVTFVFNNNGAGSIYGGLFGSANSLIGILVNGRLIIFNESGTNIISSVGSTGKLQGKISVITITAEGNGTVKYFENGVYVLSLSIASNFIFNRVLTARGDNVYNAAHFYRIQSGAMTATQVLAEYNKLRTYIPEIETVQIGSKYITSSNFQAVATPAGNVIQEMQANAAIERVVNGGFDTDTIWNKGIGWSINSGTAKSNGSQSSESVLSQGISVITGKWYKVTINVISVSVQFRAYVGSATPLSMTTSGLKTFYTKATLGSFFITSWASNIGEIDNVSCQELGWSDAEELYNGLIAQGYTAANALKEVAMWCSYDNSTANQAIYGKFYNDYAIQLLKTDMAAQNFGYHIPTEAEKAEILATYIDANDLKKEGTDHWDNALGTNASGLTLLGTGCRMPDGSFASIKKVGGFATSDGNVSKQLGLPIRLIRD